MSAEHELVQIVRTQRHVGEHGDRECRLGTRQRAEIRLWITFHLCPELGGKISRRRTTSGSSNWAIDRLFLGVSPFGSIGIFFPESLCVPKTSSVLVE